MPSPQHRRTWDLIPWLINGTASAADRSLAEAHLAACADCRDEYAFQSRVHAGLDVDTRVAGDVRPAFDRLLARIDAEQAIDAGPALTEFARSPGGAMTRDSVLTRQRFSAHERRHDCLLDV